MGNAFNSWSGFLQKTKGDPIAELTGKSDKSGDLLGLFKPKPVTPVPAAPSVADKPVTVMPDQQAIAADKRKSLADQLARRGRASTILTDQNDTLGG